MHSCSQQAISFPSLLSFLLVCVFLPRDHVQHSQTAARLYDLHVIEKPSAAR